ncbi:PREDICTED: uncharacterized protein LOC104799194 [Tarenaya hassleriana]|uniref:uncharacterized protein LOC104799194 n=1 Tax=Tarenaya hassleriana TaxID=28532 RepID=UPI00053C23C3|nr:PREDICTED: uncharacterized protein LOC104799194 [Tarenaya hassleriana]
MATEMKPGVVKRENGDGSSHRKIDPSVKDKKKIESSSRQNMTETKPRSSVSIISAKSEAKSKTTITSPKSAVTTKTTTTTTATSSSNTKVKAKREKKVYSLPGQKYDVPEEREPLRIFYESLSKQIPGSEMAEFWLMEHGMLSPERAKRAYEKKQRKQKQIRMGTPIKPPPTSSSKPGISHKTSVSKSNLDARTKKKLIVDDDDDFILSPKRRKV